MKKPGYKTTEFWISVIITIAGLLMASGAIAEGSMVARIVGGVMSALAALGYTAARAKVKAAEELSKL